MTASQGFLLGRNARLVCLGASITENPNGYVTVMQNLIAAGYPERSITVHNAGVSGNRAPDLLARLNTDVIALKPTCVTIHIGTNDVWQPFQTTPDSQEHPRGDGPGGTPLDEFEACLAQIVAHLRETTDATVVFCTPCVIGEDVDNADNLANERLQTYAATMKRVAVLHNCLVAPTHTDFVQAIRAGVAHNPDFRLTTDGVHPNAVGDHVIALSILATLGYAGLAG